MIWGMMLARFAFISLPHRALLGPLATRSRIPIRSRRTKHPFVCVKSCFYIGLDDDNGMVQRSTRGLGSARGEAGIRSQGLGVRLVGCIVQTPNPSSLTPIFPARDPTFR